MLICFFVFTSVVIYILCCEKYFCVNLWKWKLERRKFAWHIKVWLDEFCSFQSKLANDTTNNLVENSKTIHTHRQSAIEKNNNIQKTSIEMDLQDMDGIDTDKFVIFQQDDLHIESFPLMKEIRRQGKLCDVTLKVSTTTWWSENGLQNIRICVCQSFSLTVSMWCVPVWPVFVCVRAGEGR